MRVSWTRQAVICGLVAVAAADTLPLDDIPLMCVTICGPIVELTAKCNVHQHRLAKRQPDPEWVPKLAVEPPQDDELYKRSFSIIRAAPTSFPPQFEPVESTTSLSSISTSMAMAEITTVMEHQYTSLRVTTTSSSLSKSTKIQPTASASRSEARPISDTTWGARMQTASPVKEDDPEKDCVCKNKSFDVAKVAALCQDCIVVDGHKQNTDQIDMDIIMQGCGFAKRTYTPDQDSVADNVRVEATQPATMGAKDAPANSSVGLESSAINDAVPVIE
ncbi:hypothetical protein FGRMN_5990 [Fusarium graminum]|nr:hypothetical protein FGRMN_5990 [Fusarium graminum]